MSFNPYPSPDEVTIGFLRLAVSAVVWNEQGQFLLHQRGDNGYWGLPGGGVEQGETIAAAVQREVWEETGYTIAITRLVGVYSDPEKFQVIQYPDGNVVHYVTVAFEATVTGGEATLCDETLAIAWVSPDALPEPFVPAHHIRLRDTLAHQEAAFF
ncbi:MAG: NUDIX domain-containing protein [Ardenticatenales bacterium]|nr:NUDIX domain-containing protein [Ardenticatenales bacterium]